MFKGNKISEKLLYEIWSAKNFIGQIKTIDDLEIDIIDAGYNNKELAGPDFLNSRIKLGNITYLGDVEIDIWQSDWKSHGHNLDKRYNKVILHIVLSKEKLQSYVFTQDGRKVNSICLTDFVNDNYQTSIRKAIISERSNRGFVLPCSEINDSITPGNKLKILGDLGIERFKQKEKRVFERLKEMVYLKEMNVREPIVHYDFGEEYHNKKFSAEDFDDPVIWQQLIYEMIFEALGYSQNKDIMIKLAKAVNIEFFKKLNIEKEYGQIIESALFNVSGIVPQHYSELDEQTAEYVRRLIEVWSEIKNQYDGPYFTKEKWHFFKLRPQNFPTIRIVGGARVLKKLLKDELFGKVIAIFFRKEDHQKTTSMLRNSIIVKADSFWRTHYVFDKNAKDEIKYLVGLSRADEIIVNVFLPTLAVYFDIFVNKDAGKRVKSLYLNYQQKSANRIVNQVENGLHIKNSTSKSVYVQGMIELFRHYCVREKCLECEIGKTVFK